MGPESAARACELLGVRQVVPMHDGMFPLLTGTPARLHELVEPVGAGDQDGGNGDVTLGFGIWDSRFEAGRGRSGPQIASRILNPIMA